jgi:hypothetical protein
MPRKLYQVVALRLAILGLVALSVYFPLQAAPQNPSDDARQYTLTIYVQKKQNVIDQGHVFVGLSNGENTLYRGFHPRVKDMPFGSKGEIKDDDGHPWDIKSQAYKLTEEGFENALRTILQTRDAKQYDLLTNNCGDFVQVITNAAGVKLYFPEWHGITFPDDVAAFIDHGGNAIQSGQQQDPTGVTFDPSKLTPAEYEGWQRNQAIVRDETLGQSSLDLRLQKLRRQAAQANEDLADAEKELETQESAGTGSNSPAGGSLYPSTDSVGTNTRSTYQDLPNTPVWVSPRNYVCKTGPCTLEQWQRETPSTQAAQQPVQHSANSPRVPWCGAQWCAPSNYTCDFGPCTLEQWQKQNSPAQPKQQAPQQTAKGSGSNAPVKPPTPPTSSGPNQADDQAHAWLCQMAANLVKHDKDNLSIWDRWVRCEGMGPVNCQRSRSAPGYQMAAATLQMDLNAFNSNHCDPKLLH